MDCGKLGESVDRTGKISPPGGCRVSTFFPQEGTGSCGECGGFLHINRNRVENAENLSFSKAEFSSTFSKRWRSPEAAPLAECRDGVPAGCGQRPQSPMFRRNEAPWWKSYHQPVPHLTCYPTAPLFLLPAPCGSPFVRFFALHKVSHALRAIKIRHWHVRFLSETNIKKRTEKTRGRA